MLRLSMYNCCIVFSALGRREPEPITEGWLGPGWGSWSGDFIRKLMFPLCSSPGGADASESENIYSFMSFAFHDIKNVWWFRISCPWRQNLWSWLRRCNRGGSSSCPRSLSRAPSWAGSSPGHTPHDCGGSSSCSRCLQRAFTYYSACKSLSWVYMTRALILILK